MRSTRYLLSTVVCCESDFVSLIYKAPSGEPGEGEGGSPPIPVIKPNDLDLISAFYQRDFSATSHTNQLLLQLDDDLGIIASSDTW